MKTKPRFMRRLSLLFAAIASAAVMTFAGTVGQTPGISFQMLEGTWETYDASATGRQVTLSFNDDGTMQVCRVTSGDITGELPAVSYSGTYKICPEGVVTYSLKETMALGTHCEGSFSITPAGNSIDVTLNTQLEGVGEKGFSIHMFNTAECHHVSLAAKPDVLQFFSAALPYTFNPMLKDAEKLLVHGRQPVGGLTGKCVKDLRNGFVSYTGDGAPPSGMEACIWRCTDGTTLLAVNCLGEGVDVQPTVQLYFFRYDPKTRTLTRLDRMSETVCPVAVTRRINLTVKLPRQGKDIKLVTHSYEGEVTETETVTWKGNGF